MGYMNVDERSVLSDLRPKKVTHLQLLPRGSQEGAEYEASHKRREEGDSGRIA